MESFCNASGRRVVAPLLVLASLSLGCAVVTDGPPPSARQDAAASAAPPAASGARCIRLGGAGPCLPLVGDDCHEHPCPPGRFCRVRLSDDGSRVAARCMTPCGQRLTCPSGFVCDGLGCARECHPGTASDCNSDERCTVVATDPSRSACLLLP